MSVDFEPYVRSVFKEMKRGAKRPATPLMQREIMEAEAIPSGQVLE